MAITEVVEMNTTIEASEGRGRIVRSNKVDAHDGCLNGRSGFGLGTIFGEISF